MNKNYYAIIPANVRYDEDIKPNAKLLYGEITALANEKGYCWASNSYFAELYGVTTVSISNWIRELKSKKYIDTQIIYRENSKEIKERRIYIAPPIKENFNTPQTKLYGGSKENFNTPIKENFKDNNTLFNNTDERILCSTQLTKKMKEEIIKAWNDLNLQQLRAIKENTNRHNMLKARIDEYSFEEVLEAIKRINKSSFLKGQNNNSWMITFDWLVRPNNFLKVLEGNYDDKGVEKRYGGNRELKKEDEFEFGIEI